MSERTSYTPGEFGWVDLSASDVDAAASFYADLIGWSAEVADPSGESGVDYRFFKNADKLVAGLGPTMDGDQPPAWMSYVFVDDADATAEKIKAAGGQVAVGPMDLPSNAGRMAVCADLESAWFAIYQPKDNNGAELVNEVGSWTWNNLATREIEKAKSFYGEVFGWKAEHSPDSPPELPFMNWQLEGQRWEEGIAGVSDMGDDMPVEVPPHWQVYFAIGSAQDAVDKVKAGGGNVLFGPQKIPVGVVASFTDPQGAAFSVIEPDYPEPR